MWDEPAAAGGGMKLPEFEGGARITEMSFELSKKNNPLIVTTFTIVEPDKFEGRETKRFDTISTQHWPFFKGFAEQIGLELPDSPDPDDIESAVNAFMEENADKVFAVSVTVDGDYNRIEVLDGDATNDDDDDDKDDDDKKPSKARKALLDKIKKNKLKVDADDYDEDDDLEEAVKKAMKKAGKK